MAIATDIYISEKTRSSDDLRQLARINNDSTYVMEGAKQIILAHQNAYDRTRAQMTDRYSEYDFDRLIMEVPDQILSWWCENFFNQESQGD